MRHAIVKFKDGTYAVARIGWLGRTRGFVARDLDTAWTSPRYVETRCKVNTKEAAQRILDRMDLRFEIVKE